MPLRPSAVKNTVIMAKKNKLTAESRKEKAENRRENLFLI